VLSVHTRRCGGSLVGTGNTMQHQLQGWQQLPIVYMCMYTYLDTICAGPAPNVGVCTRIERPHGCAAGPQWQQPTMQPYE
jgi:hypothetical protein